MHWLMRKNIDVIGTTNLVAKCITYVGSCPIFVIGTQFRL